MKLLMKPLIIKFGLIIGLGLIYYETAELSRIIASTPENVTPVWPPDGIASAALFLFGYWIWPGIFLGSFLANIWAFLDATSILSLIISIFKVSTIAIGTSIGSFLGVFLLKKTIKEEKIFQSLTNTCRFLIITGMIGPMINATFGVTALTLGQDVPFDKYVETWLIWWVSNVSGIFIFTPVILSWNKFLPKLFEIYFNQKSISPTSIRAVRILEIISLFIIVILIGFNAFWRNYALEYMLIPCLSWVTLSFGEFGATNFIAITGIMAILGTVRGLSSFAYENLNQSLVFLQIFLGVIVFTTLVLNALISENKQALIKLKTSRQALLDKTMQLEDSQKILQDKIVEIQKQKIILSNQNIELEESKQIAEIANQAKSQFLTNISHELKTPLNGILVIAQLLQGQSNLTVEQREDLKIIYQSGDHLLTLINDILDISKIEAGKVELELQIINLQDFLYSIYLILRNSAQTKKLDFSYLFSSQLPKLVQIDEKKLKQILLNLLGNSVKFTNQGSIIFSVEPLNQTNQDNQLLTIVRFQVKDTGIGIPSDKLDKIFLSFEQLGSNNFKSEGTGLGLTISQKLANLMGGKIFVTSELGKGSIFTLDLPLVTLTDIPIQNRDKSLPSPAIDPELSKKLPFKILVAEDNKVNQKIAKRLFQRLGYEIEIVKNGLEVIEALEKKDYDVIFMDIQMPTMDGLEATRLIVNKYSDQKCPYIIAMTANSRKSNQQECFAMGMKDYISKPVKIEKIITALHNINKSR